VLPVEDPEVAYRHAVDAVNAFVPVGTPLLHDPPYMTTRGLKDDDNQLLAQVLGDAARLHGGPGERIGVPFGTNAPHYAATGCPTVVFGPGSIDQAHTADEWLDVGQLQAATDILYDFIREF
jgi:acetylornithine deacetylase